MKMLRLPRPMVKVGVLLPWNVYDGDGLLLLSRGHVVENENQLDQLLLRGAFVDAEAARVVERERVTPEPPKRPMAPPNLFALWDQTTEALKTLLHNWEGQPDFAGRVDRFAHHILGLLDVNPDVGIYRTVRQDNAQNVHYGYSHSVHTAVLCILMSRHLQWPTNRMMSLVKAALTMNITILDLQGQMAGQNMPMRDSQRLVIEQHPAQSVALLKKAGITDADWLEAVAQHHERPDGSGYPVAATEICEMAVALRVTDVFMAKISPRALREALSPQEAVRQLYREDNGGPLSTAVIKEFGIYPPGDFVKLASGELGIVVQRTSNARAPIVAVITDTAGRLISQTIRHDSGQAKYAIVGKETDKAMLKRLPPERLYGFSVVPHAQT